jgi:Spy/CpxP family protein refolding chaperone
MKRTIALFAAVLSLACASAQDLSKSTQGSSEQKPKGPNPEAMASRHSKHLQKLLGLSEEQTQKTHDALLTRFTDARAIREKAGPNADKKALHAQLKPVRQKFVSTMNGILTPEQKTKWEENRAKMKENRQKNMGEATPPAGGNNNSKKLADDDDGVDD